MPHEDVWRKKTSMGEAKQRVSAGVMETSDRQREKVVESLAPQSEEFSTWDHLLVSHSLNTSLV